MKKLIFVRHGKAEDASPAISDLERSLTIKGKTISGMMAEKLKERDPFRGMMITSPAFRALETAMIFSWTMGTGMNDFIINQRLYPGPGLNELIKMLVQEGENTDSIMLFGHNPSFSDLPDLLSGSGCDVMPKSGIICISFKIQKWSEIKPKNGKTEYRLNPEKVL